MIYYHKYFKRGREDLLEKLLVKKNKNDESKTKNTKQVEADGTWSLSMDKTFQKVTQIVALAEIAMWLAREGNNSQLGERVSSAKTSNRNAVTDKNIERARTYTVKKPYKEYQPQTGGFSIAESCSDLMISLAHQYVSVACKEVNQKEQRKQLFTTPDTPIVIDDDTPECLTKFDDPLESYTQYMSYKFHQSEWQDMHKDQSSDVRIPKSGVGFKQGCQVVLVDDRNSKQRPGPSSGVCNTPNTPGPIAKYYDLPDHWTKHKDYKFHQSERQDVQNDPCCKVNMNYNFHQSEWQHVLNDQRSKVHIPEIVSEFKRGCHVVNDDGWDSEQKSGMSPETANRKLDIVRHTGSAKPVPDTNIGNVGRSTDDSHSQLNQCIKHVSTDYPDSSCISICNPSISTVGEQQDVCTILSTKPIQPKRNTIKGSLTMKYMKLKMQERIQRRAKKKKAKSLVNNALLHRNDTNIPVSVEISNGTETSHGAPRQILQPQARHMLETHTVKAGRAEGVAHGSSVSESAGGSSPVPGPSEARNQADQFIHQNHPGVVAYSRPVLTSQATKSQALTYPSNMHYYVTDHAPSEGDRPSDKPQWLAMPYPNYFLQHPNHQRAAQEMPQHHYYHQGDLLQHSYNQRAAQEMLQHHYYQIAAQGMPLLRHCHQHPGPSGGNRPSM